MRITPEDIIWGMDPFREDLLLGFKKLTNKDEIFLGALKYSLYHGGYISSLKADASPGLIALKNRLEPSNQMLTANVASGRLIDFIRNVFDEMIVDVSIQMEKDGYDQLQDYTLDSGLNQAIFDWTWEKMAQLGLPDNKDLRDRISGLYL